MITTELPPDHPPALIERAEYNEPEYTIRLWRCAPGESPIAKLEEIMDTVEHAWREALGAELVSE